MSDDLPANGMTDTMSTAAAIPKISNTSGCQDGSSVEASVLKGQPTTESDQSTPSPSYSPDPVSHQPSNSDMKSPSGSPGDRASEDHHHKTILELLGLNYLQRYFHSADGKVYEDHMEDLNMARDGTENLADGHNDGLGEASPAANAEYLELVNQLFPTVSVDTGDSSPTFPKDETPIDAIKFRQYGHALIDYIANYLETSVKRKVAPKIEPGYLRERIPMSPPHKADTIPSIMHDFEKHIMSGVIHWQHPRFHGYFPAATSYPSILADLLGNALGVVSSSWKACPALTELEVILVQWLGKMIGLPDDFLYPESAEVEKREGGGFVLESTSECVLTALLSARHLALERLRKQHPNTDESVLSSRLIAYCSKEAHPCIQEAAQVGLIKMRVLEVDKNFSLRGDTLRKAMAADRAQSLEPFMAFGTLGTTSCASFDNLQELGEVCESQKVWLHVDAAYAGTALVCPEFKYLLRGIEKVMSISMSPNKWMLVNTDCSVIWAKDRSKLMRACEVEGFQSGYAQEENTDSKYHGVATLRSSRALSMWFVIRNYGVEGIEAHVRNHVRLAKLFEQCIRRDSRFTIVNDVVLGLVCFRLNGSDDLNQKLLERINESAKLHLTSTRMKEDYVLRFCICHQRASEADILYANRCIREVATKLLAESMG